MVFSIKESCYYLLPNRIQNYLVSYYGGILFRKRYSPPFDDLIEEIKNIENLNSDQIEELQFTRLLKVLNHARKYVPYYQKLFRRIGFNISRLQDLKDIEKIPILEKDEFRKNANLFRTTCLGENSYIVQNTSGTTGMPLSIEVNEITYKLAMALVLDHEQVNGVSFGETRATFAGKMVQRIDDNNPPFWRYNKAENQMIFSSYHISRKNIPHYTNELNSFKPQELIGYPSAIYDLAFTMKQANQKLNFRPKLVVTNSETLLAWQRKMIEDQFSCPVRDYYGTAEYVVFAGECARHSYHVNPLLGILEIVDESNKPVIGQTGDIIATSLVNNVMPLIRYRIGDRAEIKTGDCDCGSKSLTLKIIAGRIDDYIVTSDNRKIGRLDHIFKGLTDIKEGQIIQISRDECVIKIVKAGNKMQIDKEALIKNFKERVGSDMITRVEFVNEIEKGKNGKFKAVINLIEQA